MTTQREPHAESPDRAAVDPIDREAAQIDARSEDAPEQIEELIEHAQELGRHPEQPIDVDDSQDPEVLPG